MLFENILELDKGIFLKHFESLASKELKASTAEIWELKDYMSIQSTC